MGRMKSNIQLNGEVVRTYLKSRGMSMPKLAADLNINYSHLYRVVKGEKNVGMGLFRSLQRYCERKGLDYKEFIVELPDDRKDSVVESA